MVNLYRVWNTVLQDEHTNGSAVSENYPAHMVLPLKSLSTIEFAIILNIFAFLKKKNIMVLRHNVEQNKDVNSHCRFTTSVKGCCHGSGTTVNSSFQERVVKHF